MPLQVRAPPLPPPPLCWTHTDHPSLCTPSLCQNTCCLSIKYQNHQFLPWALSLIPSLLLLMPLPISQLQIESCFSTPNLEQLPVLQLQIWSRCLFLNSKSGAVSCFSTPNLQSLPVSLLQILSRCLFLTAAKHELFNLFQALGVNIIVHCLYIVLGV